MQWPRNNVISGNPPGTSFILTSVACYGITSFGVILINSSWSNQLRLINFRRRHSLTFGRVRRSPTRTRGVTTWRSRPAPRGSSHRRAASQTTRPTFPPARSSSTGGLSYPPRLRYKSITQYHLSENLLNVYVSIQLAFLWTHYRDTSI